MKIFLVTYDLKTPGRDYEVLYEEIRSVGNAIRPLESVWIVASESDAFQIKDRLYRVVDVTDNILVAHIASDIAGAHDYGKEIVSWILDQLR